MHVSVPPRSRSVRSIPANPAATGGALDRRRLLQLAAAAGAAGLLTGCGGIRLGQPETYTPPPEGIDDLYLADLQDALATALELARAGVESPDAASATAQELSLALADQQQALLTGAQAEDAESSSSDGSSATPRSPVPAQQLLDAITDLRDLTIDAARQCSGALARPVIAIGAHLSWVMPRLATAASLPAPSAPPAPKHITATRTVPASDPPSIGAPSDYATLLELMQSDEWFAGYVFEVLAARTEGKRRRHFRRRSRTHRDRARRLGTFADEAGATVVAQEAVYPLDEKLMAEGEVRVQAVIDERLLDGHVALVGAAPFEKRPLPISAALTQATWLADVQGHLAALPSLETEDD